MEVAIVWFRQDLRLADNPAWGRAVASGAAVVPVYIWAPEEAGRWAPGGAARWWLHHALADLDAQLRALGSRLVLRAGDSAAQIAALLDETGAAAVYWNRCYEPWRTRLDGALKARLRAEGRAVWSGNSALLREPWEVATGAGGPFMVFTPYSRACARLPEPAPLGAAGRPTAPARWPEGLAPEDLRLLPELGWDAGFYECWEPTRAGGLRRMGEFLDRTLAGYGAARDLPAVDGTSRLSPYLHWGQLGPREVAAALGARPASPGLAAFHRELLWREFAYHVLYHFPETAERPLQPKFNRFPWHRDPELLRAWQRGRTGYPLVDAGMRQLWRTGWMHNRVRMVVASFLVKHLLHSWEDGARWFWDTLVDADLASNTLGWQWAGGCGADAAPYFRIFNPVTQGRKFDPDGVYIRAHVPELRGVPDAHLHAPWEMPPALQRQCGCVIGRDYPAPVVEHKAARERALAALATLREDRP